MNITTEEDDNMLRGKEQWKVGRESVTPCMML